MSDQSPMRRISRRHFLQAASAATTTFVIPQWSRAAFPQMSRPVRLGLIADLHQDVMHDGPLRLEFFLEAMRDAQPDVIVQLGDFAVPSKSNQKLIDTFNAAHSRALHVVGNHDTDEGYSPAQLLESWGIKRSYDAHEIAGLRVIILDGNDRPPNHAGGYPSHVGPEQLEWLQGELDSHKGPMIILSHQPLAGPWAIDNAAEVQQILSTAADRIVLAINGHSHIDYVTRIGGINYLHHNSASYVVVGRDYAHEIYPPEVHAAHPRLASICPYREALFSTLTFDPGNGQITIEGRTSQWVGPSSAELGRDKHPDLINGEHIAPRIRNRQFTRVS
ncbi:MAG: metallophosphoesterase [Planctomycetaceae bacterium]